MLHSRSQVLRRTGIPLLLLLLLLSLPLVSIALWLAAARGPRALAAYAASVALVLWLVACFARSWRAFFAVNTPLFLLSAGFAAYVAAYSGPPGDFISYVLATTTWAECVGFFGIWQGERLLLGGLLLAAAYVWLALRAPAAPIRLGRSAATRLAPLIAILLACAWSAQHPAALIDGLAANPVVGTAMFVAGPLRHAMAAVEGTAVKKVPFGASRAAGDEIHILVIGESARRDSWSVYGYARQTTPRMEALHGEAVFLRDASADANVTISAVPILLTGTTPEHLDLHAVRGTLVDLAREAGYRTSWLMNQDPHISLLLGIHADRMDYPPSLSTLLAGHLPLDEEVLPALRQQLARHGSPQFIGLHLIGSHWEYASRYPASFAYFHSTVQAPGRDLVDAYDDSVRYTDWILDQVISAVRRVGVPATVTYVADHGEDLYALDGSTGHGSPAYSTHQFQIPAFVWMNDAFRTAHPDKAAAVLANAAKHIRSYDVFCSVADLMGIQWPGYVPENSFASARFVPDLTSPLIAGGIRVTPGS